MSSVEESMILIVPDMTTRAETFSTRDPGDFT